jgi:hypothetical protein
MVLVLIIIAAGCVRIKSHDTDAYDEGERYGESDNRADNGKFYAGTQRLELMGMFKELEFSTRRSYPDITEMRAGASFRLIGEEVVDGQNTKHFTCTYYDYPDEFGYEGELEVWINKNCEAVQAKVDDGLVTGPETGPATLELEYVLSMLNSDTYSFVFSEDELKEHLREKYISIDKASQEVRDFGFGDVEVIHYEFTKEIAVEDYDYNRTDNLVWEYARIGPKFLFTKSVYSNSEGSFEEHIVERVIPY